MKFKWRLKKNQLAKTILTNQFQRDRLANCYLIVGPQGVGKNKLIEDFIKIIRCQSSGTKPCGKCAGCQMIANRSDTEFLIVESEKKRIGKGSGKIRIEETREIRRKIKLKTFSRRKIVWIKEASQLTIPAANNILKILEDPSGQNRVIFFLTAENLNLPATIISRAQLIFLHPVDLTTGERQIAGKSSEKTSGSPTDQKLSSVERVVAFSGLEELLSHLQKDQVKQKKVANLFSLYRQLKNGSITDRIEAVDKKLIGWPIEELYFYLILYEREALYSSFEDSSFSHHKENLRNLLESQEYLSYQVNKKILLKNLFLKLK
jgi:DNA polymerase III delta prime subunit